MRRCETKSLSECVQITKKRHGLGVEQQEFEHDLDSGLFVGAVTTDVQI